MDNLYIKGQEDLIKNIKSDVLKIRETSTKEDYLFDLLSILMQLKPINQNKDELDK